MGKFVDLVDKKFGRLSVIKRVDNTKQGTARYLCKCSCGKEIIVNSGNLNSGGTISCGCYKNERIKELNRIEYSLSAKRGVFKSYKATAKRKNISFGLTFEQFINLTQKNCYYCNSEPTNLWKGTGNGDFKYNGIDRINNTKGYTIENCVSCCKICNSAKGDKSTKDFINWIVKLFFNMKNNKGIQINDIK